MKWPYTVNVGGVTFYCPEHIESERREALWDGITIGLSIGVIFMSFLVWLHG